MNINNLKEKIESSQIKGIVFDIGNTLVPYDEMAVAREVSKYSDLKSKSLDLVFRTIFRSQIRKNFLMGLIYPSEYFKKIKEKLKLNSLSEKDFFHLYEKVFLPPNQEMVELLEKAKKRGLKIALLSDIDSVLYFSLKEKYSWIREADCEALSWRLKSLKPDYRFFDMIEEKLAFHPQEIFYIDDIRTNMVAGAARGWIVPEDEDMDL